MAKKEYKVWQRDMWPFSINIILCDGSRLGWDIIAEVLSDAGSPTSSPAKFNANPKNIESRRQADIMCAALNEKRKNV